MGKFAVLVPGGPGGPPDFFATHYYMQSAAGLVGSQADRYPPTAFFWKGEKR